MAIAYVQAQAGSRAWDSAHTVAITPAAGNLLVAVCVSQTSGRTISSVTDSKSQTWSKVNDYDRAGSIYVTLYYLASCQEGATTITMTASAAGNGMVHVIEFSGCATTSPLDLDLTSNNYGTAVTTANGTSTTNDEVLVFGAAWSGNTNTGTAGSNETEAVDSGGGWIGYRIVSAAGSYPSETVVTISASDSWICVMGSFKIASATGPSIPDDSGGIWRGVNLGMNRKMVRIGS